MKKKFNIKDVHNIVNNVFPTLVFQAIKNICIKKIKIFKKQNNKKAKYYNQRKPSDGRIEWYKKNSIEIFNLIRAISKPYPGAYTFNLKKKKIKIFKANVFYGNLKNLKTGEVKKVKDCTFVKCKKGFIQIISSSSKFKNREILI